MALSVEGAPEKAPLDLFFFDVFPPLRPLFFFLSLSLLFDASDATEPAEGRDENGR